jgi:hypothetical protein
MSDRIKLPLNTQAMSQADDEFYEHHPELVQDGDRTPIDPSDPAQASLRKEWMDLYFANGGELEANAPSKKKPADHTQTCLVCSENQGLLVVNVVDEYGTPVAGALVTADGLQMTTDQNGIADFGPVAAKTYNIAASKKEFYRIGIGVYLDTATVEPEQTATATLGLAPCTIFDLAKRFKVAEAWENFASAPKRKITIPDSAGGPFELDLFDDIVYGAGEPLPSGDSVGNDEAVLRDKMAALLILFAQNAADDFPWRCFGAFFQKNATVTIYSDPMLNKAIENSVNFNAFAERTLGAPGTKGANPSKMRIHQWLASYDWDINQMGFTEVSPPAFNDGSLRKFSGDYGNGLTILINAVQHVLVFVDAYHYDSCQQQYTITLIFELYDVFGLDNDDLGKYGTSASGVPWWVKAWGYASDDTSVTLKTMEEGFTAWWQLQHQFNYAPMVTKSAVTKTYTISTAAK